MTVPPLPASPCVRCRLDYTNGAGTLAGSRFYLSYTGSAPSGANCATLAATIAAAWGTELGPLISTEFSLVEVDVIDIATDTGLSGQWTGETTGGASGGPVPSQAAMNVEFGIARRYRGGKPRMYLPPSSTGQMENGDKWNDTLVEDVNTNIALFFADVIASPPAGMGALAHVNLSYYQGFHNVTNSSGRIHAAPLYRTAALVDAVTGYSMKAVMGSQRRRRTATTS